MYINIIILSALSSIFCLLFGKNIGYQGVKIISIGSVLSTWLLSIYAFYHVGFLKNPYYLVLGTWVNSDMLNIDWSFLFDGLTVTMLIVVNTVSALVHIYASSYMSEDPHLSRFMSYLSLFTFFIETLSTLSV